MSAGVGSWATIFTTHLSSDSEGYGEMSDRMAALFAGYYGYLGMESVRGDDGVGITVCYWESREAIEAWGLDPEHQEAQREGLARWYDHITLRNARVERFSEYTRPVAGAEGAAQGVE